MHAPRSRPAPCRRMSELSEASVGTGGLPPALVGGVEHAPIERDRRPIRSPALADAVRRTRTASTRVGQLFAAQGQEQLPEATAGSGAGQPNPSNAEVVRIAPTSRPCQLTSAVELSSFASG